MFGHTWEMGAEDVHVGGRHLLAVEADGTGLDVGSRCSGKQLVAIVLRVWKEREREGRERVWRVCL